MFRLWFPAKHFLFFNFENSDLTLNSTYKVSIFGCETKPETCAVTAEEPKMVAGVLQDKQTGSRFKYLIQNKHGGL